MLLRRLVLPFILLMVGALMIAPVSAQPVVVTIFVGLGTGTAPDQIVAQEALKAKFNAEHSDIQIDFLIVPHEEAGTRLVAAVAGGAPPGLVGPHGVSTVSEYIDYWADITPLIQAENYDMSDFYSRALELNITKDINAGLPLGLYPSFIFYSLDAFDAAGVPYPPSDYADTAWTIDELSHRAMLLTLDENFNDVTMPEFNPNAIIQYGFSDAWITGRGLLAFWGAENVGRPTNADYTLAVANSPEWIEGAQWYSDAINIHHFMPDPEGVAFLESAGIGTPMDSGNLAMFHSHTWFMSELGSTYRELPFELQIAPVPFNRQGERIARAHSDIFTIPAAYPDKESAWKVMKWLTSAEHIVEVCVIYGCIPARESARDTHQLILAETFPTLNLNVVYEALNYIDFPNHESYVPAYGRINDAIENAMSLMAQGVNTDANAVMNELNTTIQNILNEQAS